MPTNPEPLLGLPPDYWNEDQMISVTQKFDTDKEAEEWLTYYMKSYHPAGYGTFVKARYTDKDGKITVHVMRGTTCD